MLSLLGCVEVLVEGPGEGLMCCGAGQKTQKKEAWRS